jgi:hypothetical protein
MTRVLTFSETERLNAAHYNVEYRYMASTSSTTYESIWKYKEIDKTIFRRGQIPWMWNWDRLGLPYGYFTLPSGWTEITDRVTAQGSLTHEIKDSSIVWNINVEGWNYDESYLGTEHALVCFVRYWTPTTGWSVWGLDWIGVITKGDFTSNYKKGDAWKRNITGENALLERIDSPQITLGPTDAARNASVTVSTTLSTPAVESGIGEFVGTTANVEGKNIVDGNRSTLWISSGTPSETGESPAQQFTGIDEVFFKPVAGFSVNSTWWIELFLGYSQPAKNPADVVWDLAGRGGAIVLINQDGVHIGWPGRESGGKWMLRGTQRAIICQDRALFEAYVGHVGDVAFIAEARHLDPRDLQGRPAEFTLNPNGGFVQLLTNEIPVGWSNGDWGNSTNSAEVDTVVWSMDGHSVKNKGWNSSGPFYNAMPSINVGALLPGQSIRRKPSGTDTPTNPASDWVIDSYPTPGGYDNPNAVEWALLDLQAQDATATDILAGATELTLSSAKGFLSPVNTIAGISGVGLVDSIDTFKYTNVDYALNKLTGIPATGANSLQAHAGTVSVLPMALSVAQTGWPITKLVINRRPGLSTIRKCRVYITKYSASDTPGSVGWEQDYEAGWTINNSANTSSVELNFMDQRFIYMRRILIVIDAMSDGGRAKINEVNAWLFPTLVGGLGGLNGLRSGEMAHYLLVTIYGLAEAKFGDFTNNSQPTIVSYSTAITSIYKVLNDLARATGCLVYYGLDGEITWLPDPWWPIGLSGDMLPSHIFTADEIRGDISTSDEMSPIDGVAVSGTTPDGTQSWRATFGNTTAGFQIKEYADYIAYESFGHYIAESLLFQETHNYTISFTIKGLAEWLEPAQVVSVAWDLRGDGTNDNYNWIVQAVTRNWNKAEHTWSTQVDAKLYGYFNAFSAPR